MVYICTKYHENILNDIRLMDGRIKSYYSVDAVVSCNEIMICRIHRRAINTGNKKRYIM